MLIAMLRRSQSYILYDFISEMGCRCHREGCKEMSLFAALRPAREILLGKDQSRAVGAVAAKYGAKALICTDARFAATPAFSKIADTLKAAGLVVHIHDRVEPDVPYESVALCADEARSFGPDVVIGVGG